jgi:hypothetical protein
MPASVNKIKKPKKEKSMGRPAEPIHGPAEPIHGCNILLCMPPLVGTADRWCRSPNPRAPLPLVAAKGLQPAKSAPWTERGGASVLLACGRRGKSEKRKRGREGDGKLPRCRRAATSDLDAAGGRSPWMRPYPGRVREEGPRLPHRCRRSAVPIASESRARKREARLAREGKGSGVLGHRTGRRKEFVGPQFWS